VRKACTGFVAHEDVGVWTVTHGDDSDKSTPTEFTRNKELAR
jgi:hypothetical protein